MRLKRMAWVGFVGLLLGSVAVSASADCAPTDFAIQGFQVTAGGAGLGTRMIMKGTVVNHCAQGAAPQISIVAKDDAGRVIQEKKGWPAGTTNIGAGQSVSFDLGRLFRYRPDMATYTVSVASVRTW